MAERWSPTYAPPSVSAVGDAVAEGDDPRLARASHVHGREGFGVPVAVTPDAAAAPGTATTVVRSDHQHGIATAATAPPAVGTVGAAGTAGSAPARGDHTHAMGILTTRGDVLTRDATGFIRLALGASGQVLQSNGLDLVWGGTPPPSFVSMAKWYTD